MINIKCLILSVLLWGVSSMLQAQMLIVSAPEYMAEMKPFVSWKIQKGMTVQLVSMSDIGTTAADLKTYVAEYYQAHHNRYLLLVGDAAQIPAHISYGITKPLPTSAYSDAEYGYISDGDYPPEVLVGRFSAESAEDVRTQVNRVIFYERDIDNTATWLQQSIGIANPSASEKGDNDETDIQHIRKINETLSGYGYAVHEVNMKKQLTDLLNSGCGLLNYVGHGYTTSWQTTDFSIQDAALLTNENRLPVILAAGCQNGHFRLGTCLAESFLRSRSAGGKPVGAVGMLAFSTQIHWNPPMLGQDEFVRILTSDELSASDKTFGEIVNSSYKKVIEKYKGSGLDVAQQWVLFGDPSMQLRARIPEKMNISHIKAADYGIASLQIQCNVEKAIVALSVGDRLLASQSVENGSADLSFPVVNLDETLCVTITYPDKVTYVGYVVVGNGSGIDSSQESSVRVYPNPTRDKIRIDGYSGSLITVSVYSIEGKLIKNINVDSSVPFSLGVSPGTYFLQLQDGKAPVHKVIILR